MTEVMVAWVAMCYACNAATVHRHGTGIPREGEAPGVGSITEKGIFMRLSEVLTVVNGRFISPNVNPNIEVQRGFAADLMSDALRYRLCDALLVSGLANHQVVRTAEMADVRAILMVRGKVPAPETLDLAEEVGIPFLGTNMTMFESCARLFDAGLGACHPYGE
jgi:hypothetical protein